MACEKNNFPLAEVIEDILRMEEGELKLLLRGLSSLMNEVRRSSSRNMPSPHSHMFHFVTICSIQVTRPHSMSIDKNMKARLLYAALRSLYNHVSFGGK